MLKPHYFLRKVFKYNKKVQDNIFKLMCDFISRSDRTSGRRDLSSYLGVDTIKYQERLINPTPVDCITGYIIYNDVSYRSLNNLHNQRLKLGLFKVAGKFLTILN